MMFRRKKLKTGPELSREEMEELVNENIQFARKYASDGNVSGMKMSLEVAMQYAQKIGRSFSSQEIGRIKLMGYERGEKVMLERMEIEKCRYYFKVSHYYPALYFPQKVFILQLIFLMKISLDSTQRKIIEYSGSYIGGQTVDIGASIPLTTAKRLDSEREI